MQAGPYQIEAELLGATPRRVRYSSTIRALRFWLRAILGAIMIAIFASAVIDLRDIKMLQAEGRRVIADVVGGQVTHIGESNINELAFEFTEGGHRFTGADRVDQS